MILELLRHVLHVIIVLRTKSNIWWRAFEVANYLSTSGLDMFPNVPSKPAPSMSNIQLLLTLLFHLLTSQTLVSSLTPLIRMCLILLNRVDFTFKTYPKVDNVSSTHLSPSQNKSHYLSGELFQESDNWCPYSCPWPLQSTIQTVILNRQHRGA